MTGVERAERVSETDGPTAEPDGNPAPRELGPLAAALRFPVPLLCALAIAWVGFEGSLLRYQGPEPWILHTVLATAVAGFCASLLIALAGEARNWRWWKKTGLGLLAVAALAPFFRPLLFSREISLHPAALMLSAPFLLLAILTPALQPGAQAGVVTLFARAFAARSKKGIWVAALLSLPALGVAFLQPFDVQYPSIRYEQAKILLFVTSPLWAWWFLAGLPSPRAVPRPSAAPRRWAGTVTVPVGMVCLLLLYVLPITKSTIGQLADWAAIGLAATASLIWLAASPQADSGSHLQGIYHRFLPAMAAIPLCLMGLLSVADYGQSPITAAAYLVMLLAVWAVGVALYLAFRPRRAAIAAPLFLAFLLAAGSFGPWGLWQATTNSRLAELERLLTDAGLLAHGRIVMRGTVQVGENVRAEGERILRDLYSSGRGAVTSRWIKSLHAPREVSDDPEIAAIDRYLDTLSRYPTWKAAMLGTRLKGPDVIVVPELRKIPVAPAPASPKVPGEERVVVIPTLAPETSTPDPNPDITLIGPWALGVKSDVIPVSGYAVVENIAMLEDGSTSREVITQDSGDRFRIQFPSSDGVVSVTMPDGHGVDLDLIAYALKHEPNQYILENRKGPLRAKIILTYMNVRRSPDGEYRLTDFRGLIAVGREAGE